NNSISVADELIISSGKIVTGSNTIALTNTAAQPVSGYGESAFIDGRVSIAFPDDAGASRVFPVGKGNVYRPVVIQQTAASNSPVVRVERSEEHTSELQSRENLVCRLLLVKKKNIICR